MCVCVCVCVKVCESVPDISQCSVGVYMPSTYHYLYRTVCYLLFTI